MNVKPPWTRVEQLFFGAYLFWMSIGIIVTFFNITPGSLAVFHGVASLRVFIFTCFAAGDPILILLAAFNTYLLLAHAWNQDMATAWTLRIIIISALIETVGTLSGFPFGPYHYTTSFGPMIMHVLPVTIPLAWFVILSCALVCMQVFHGLSKIALAAGTATLATFMDSVMEPFAVQTKHYWTWHTPNHMPPCQNYISWWMIAFLILLFFQPLQKKQSLHDVRPWFILDSMLLLFAIGA